METDLGIRVSREGVSLFPPHPPPRLPPGEDTPRALCSPRAGVPGAPMSQEGRGSLTGFSLAARHNTQLSAGRQGHLPGESLKAPNSHSKAPSAGGRKGHVRKEQRTDGQKTNFELPIFPLKLTQYFR